MIPYTFVTMGEYVHYYKSLVPVPVFIPVPLHQARQRSRGFNQSQLISDIWHAGLGFDVESTLISRVRNTPPQALLGSAKKRYENVRGAFFINTNKSDIVNNNYIIVDDVWTTGSTIKEMCGILKRAGARKVFALCLAH